MAAGVSTSFLFLLSVLNVCFSKTLVGFSYDARREGATSSPKEILSFLKENKVFPSDMKRIFAADHSVLDELSDTGVPVDIYLNETQVEHLRKSKSSTLSWLRTNLLTFLPHVNITSIILGTSSNNSIAQIQLPLLFPTLTSIHSVLTSFALESQVKVSVSLSLSFLENINKKQESGDLHEIVNFLRKSKSFMVIETVINRELNMGERITQLVIERVINVSTALYYSGVPLVVTVSSSVVSNAVDVSEFSSKIMRNIESNTEAKGSVSGLFAQISPMVKSEKKLNNEEEQMLASSHKLHDMKQKPISTRTTLYEHDVISSPAATLPTNPTPTIVTVPSTNPVTNPVTITPTNPATTPVTVPSTPVTVPSVNPVNPPATVPITNPVTTPITTPSPTTPIITNPVTTYPVSPPGSIPVTTPVTTPTTNPAAPATTGAPIIPGQSWCIAKSGILQNALQNALDYACGIGGADCSVIQPTESCYNPNTLQNHASYAFNSYFQKNPVPSSCDFGGTAVIVNTNPSIGSCVYPSTSTPTSSSSSSSSSLLSPPATSSNSPAPVFGTSNPATPTTIFGTQPPPGSSTSVSISATLQPQVGYIILVMPIIFVTLTMRM